jgi:hypothetical protein
MTSLPHLAGGLAWRGQHHPPAQAPAGHRPQRSPGRAFEGLVPAHHDCRAGRDRTVAALKLLALQT